MFGLMLESEHKRIAGCMRDTFGRQISIEQSHVEQADAINKLLKKRNSDLVEMNASKADKIHNLQSEITALSDRLLNAVEGLWKLEVEILRARQDGDYLYKVICNDLENLIRVPKISSNYDYEAKMKFIAMNKLKRSEVLKLCRATRLSL